MAATCTATASLYVPTCTVTASLYVLMEIEETATTPAEKRLYSCEESGGANPCLGDCWGGCGPKKAAPSAMLIKSIHFPNDAQRRAIAGQTKMLEAKRTGINLIFHGLEVGVAHVGCSKMYETNTRAATAATTTTTTTFLPKCCRLSCLSVVKTERANLWNLNIETLIHQPIGGPSWKSWWWWTIHDYWIVNVQYKNIVSLITTERSLLTKKTSLQKQSHWLETNNIIDCENDHKKIVLLPVPLTGNSQFPFRDYLL